MVVEVAQKTDPQHQVATATFLVTPDGKHLIANNLEMLAFGEHPYAETRDVLMQGANGPSRGAADKKFELVEFADFQCPHCKATQPIIERLLADFPQAHFVFENFPLTTIHSEAYKAAAYSVCVAQQGNAAFFKFADDVFNNQENLTPNSSDAVLSDAATKAGLDGAKVGACSYSQAAKDAVDASIKLGKDLNIDETPMLFINGRQVPVGEVANNQLPYETLKQMVEYINTKRIGHASAPGLLQEGIAQKKARPMPGFSFFQMPDYTVTGCSALSHSLGSAIRSDPAAARWQCQRTRQQAAA